MLRATQLLPLKLQCCPAANASLLLLRCLQGWCWALLPPAPHAVCRAARQPAPMPRLAAASPAGRPACRRRPPRPMSGARACCARGPPAGSRQPAEPTSGRPGASAGALATPRRAGRRRRSPAAHLEVQLVVQVLVDLLAVAVLLEQAAQHAHAADPQDLGGQARLARTAALACRQGGRAREQGRRRQRRGGDSSHELHTWRLPCRAACASPRLCHAAFHTPASQPAGTAM